MVKRNLSHSKGHHPQIRLTASTFRVAEVFDLNTFLLFPFHKQEGNTALNTHVCLCFSSFPLPIHGCCTWHGLSEVANIGQPFCFDQPGGIAPASFGPAFSNWPQGSCTREPAPSPLKLLSLPKCSEHPQNAFILLLYCFFLLTLSVDAFISVVGCLAWLSVSPPTPPFVWIV